MKKSPLAAALAVVILAGCAASPETISCLQPNRRVSVEISGYKVKPPAKPGAKPGRDNVLLKALVQGNSAWDYGGATLKADGKADLDKLVKTVNEGAGRDKRPTNVNSIIITGYSDRYEVKDGKSNLDEDRAKVVRDYLVGKGLDQKLIFWEGKDDKDPVAVTKFCEN